MPSAVVPMSLPWMTVSVQLISATPVMLPLMRFLWAAEEPPIVLPVVPDWTMIPVPLPAAMVPVTSVPT